MGAFSFGWFGLLKCNFWGTNLQKLLSFDHIKRDLCVQKREIVLWLNENLPMLPMLQMLDFAQLMWPLVHRALWPVSVYLSRRSQNFSWIITVTNSNNLTCFPITCHDETCPMSKLSGILLINYCVKNSSWVWSELINFISNYII